MSEWPLFQLGDLVDNIAYGTSVKCSETASGIPVLRMGNVRYDGGLDLEDLKYANLDEMELKRFGLACGDIIFNRTNSKELVGKTGLWDGRFPAAAASYFIRIKVNRDLVAPEWIWRFMNSPMMKERLFQTSRGAIGQANINSEELRSFLVPVPPIVEQQRILSHLDLAASIRHRAAEARAKAWALIPALYIDVFGDPAINPKSWPVTTIGEVLESATYGTSQKASEVPSGVPILRMGNVNSAGLLDTSDLKYADLHSSELRKSLLNEGDLLFNRTNSKELVGKTGIWDGRFQAAAASYFIRLRVDRSTIFPLYLWAYMNTRYMKSVMFNTARGAIGQANINTKELRGFRVPLPPLAIQSVFIKQAGKMEAIATALDRTARKAETMASSTLSSVFG